MKKILLAVATILAPAMLMAENPYPMAGCGLAYMLFSKDDNGKGVQIFAGTTNNSLGSQSFGITSGTSGCTEGGVMKASAETQAYAEVNFKSLQRDAAAGGGEYLNNLAGLLGVKSEKRADFGRLAKVRYGVIFPSASAGSQEMISGFLQALSDHPELRG